MQGIGRWRWRRGAQAQDQRAASGSTDGGLGAPRVSPNLGALGPVSPPVGKEASRQGISEKGHRYI